MPKLDKKVADAVNKAASESGFVALEPSVYRARLSKVEARVSSSQNPMWTWEFEVIEEPYVGRKLWNNTTLIDSTWWKVAETFAAFGVDSETDTDELIGCTVALNVTQRVIPTGNRAGQTGNNVDQVLPDTDPGAVRHPDSSLGKGKAKAESNGDGNGEEKAAKKAKKVAKAEF